MSAYTLTVLGWHPTPVNRLLRTVKARIRHKKDDRLAVWGANNDAMIPPPAGRRRVSLVIVLAKGQRACDVDAYWKSLLDALKQNHLIVNDSPKWVETAGPRFERNSRPATVIILEDIP